jgi:hypothetical protein
LLIKGPKLLSKVARLKRYLPKNKRKKYSIKKKETNILFNEKSKKYHNLDEARFEDKILQKDYDQLAEYSRARDIPSHLKQNRVVINKMAKNLEEAGLKKGFDFEITLDSGMNELFKKHMNIDTDYKAISLSLKQTNKKNYARIAGKYSASINEIRFSPAQATITNAKANYLPDEGIINIGMVSFDDFVKGSFSPTASHEITHAIKHANKLKGKRSIYNVRYTTTENYSKLPGEGYKFFMSGDELLTHNRMALWEYRRLKKLPKQQRNLDAMEMHLYKAKKRQEQTQELVDLFMDESLLKLKNEADSFWNIDTFIENTDKDVFTLKVYDKEGRAINFDIVKNNKTFQETKNLLKIQNSIFEEIKKIGDISYDIKNLLKDHKGEGLLNKVKSIILNKEKLGGQAKYSLLIKEINKSSLSSKLKSYEETLKITIDEVIDQQKLLKTHAKRTNQITETLFKEVQEGYSDELFENLGPRLREIGTIVE